MLALIIILAIATAIIMVLVFIYNRLITLQNQYKNSFAQIEVQLKRRYDLIPNLVETAKGYMKHEKDTLTEVVDLRNQAVKAMQNAAKDPGNAEIMAKFNQVEQKLQSAMGKINVAFEAYPELKADGNMMALHEEIASTENRVAFARQAFNDGVTEFNSYKQQFPANIVANSFSFKDAQLLEFADHEQIQSAPGVSF